MLIPRQGLRRHEKAPTFHFCLISWHDLGHGKVMGEPRQLDLRLKGLKKRSGRLDADEITHERLPIVFPWHNLLRSPPELGALAELLLRCASERNPDCGCQRLQPKACLLHEGAARRGFRKARSCLPRFIQTKTSLVLSEHCLQFDCSDQCFYLFVLLLLLLLLLLLPQLVLLLLLLLVLWLLLLSLYFYFEYCAY